MRRVSVFRSVPHSVPRRGAATAPLRGRTAIITGSTSGIGLGFAAALVQQGADVCLNGFGDAAAVAALLREFRAAGVRAVHHAADLARPEDVRALVAYARDTLGHVDILVNNAGIQHVSPVEDFDDAKWDAVLAVNLSSVFHATKAVLPEMRARGWGRVVTTASVHGLVASKHKSAYVASKHAVVGFTKAIALELAGSGVTANCINPGWVLTDLVRRQIEQRAAAEGVSLAEAQARLLAEKQPSGQFATVEQLGGTLAFLCSPAADQITGISIPVDGGWTAQ